MPGHRRILVVAAALGLGAACRVASLPLVRIDALEPGQEGCEAGGVLVHSGSDDDADATLSDDEITETQTLCNGTSGTDGTNGTDGSDGSDGTDGAAIHIIDTDTTWSTDTEVSMPTLVTDAATLTVEAGVAVGFLPGVELWLQGTLVAQGEEASPVVFAPAIGTLGSTVHLAGASPSTVQHTRFEHIDLHSTGGSLAEVAHTTFVDATLGLYDQTGATLVDDCSFLGLSSGARIGIDASAADALTVQSSTFDGSGGGIHARSTTLTVTDSTFADVRGNGIFSDLNSTSTLSGITITDADAFCVLAEGPLTMTDSSVEGCRYDGVRTNSQATLTDVTARRARYAIWHDWDEFAVDPPPSFTGTNLTVSDSLRGVWVQTDGAIDIDGATVSDVDPLECIYIDGDATLANLDARRCGQDGVQLVGGGSIDTVVVDEAGTYGVVSNGVAGKTLNASNLQISHTGNRGLFIVSGFDAVTVSDVTVATTTASDCVAVTSASNTLERLTLSDCANDGVILGGGGTVRDSTITDTGGDGIQINTAPAVASLDNITITNAGVRGVYSVTLDQLRVSGLTVTNAGNDGLYSNALDTAVEGSVFTNSGAQGIEIQGPAAALTDVRVDGAASYGVWVEQGDLDHIAVTGAGSYGVYADGWGAGSLRNSQITGSGDNGMQCRHSNDPTRSMFDVLDNNITDNVGAFDMLGTGVDHCRLVDGNHIARNGVADGVDDRDDRGTLDDDVRDSDGDTDNGGTQVEDVDRIDTVSDTELTGTGPRN